MAPDKRAALIKDLAAMVGAAQVLDCPMDGARYVEDGRGGSDGQALAVVRPATAAEVAGVVRLAHRHRVHLVIQGARTGLVGAGIPDASGEQLVISMERLSRRIEIDVANRTATVDAGVRLSALNAAAAEHGLFFPIDLGADPTIGGMVAANTGGARLVRYGDMRRNLLALEVVSADGDAAPLTLGKPLWKDSATLDLKQLFVGSAGSMGVITAATVALQPLAANRTAALIAVNDPQSVPQMLVALEAELGTLLTAFEGMSHAALAATFAHVPKLRNPFAGEIPAYALLVELSAGRALEVGRLEEMLAGALEPFMSSDDTAVVDVAIDRGDRLWAIRHAIPEGLRASGTVIACDIAMRRGDVIRFRQEAVRALAALDPELIAHDFGHVGDGGLHFNMVWPSGAGPLPSGLADRARDLVFRLVVERFNGSFSAEHGVGPRNAGYYGRFVNPAERVLAGRLQRALAPEPVGRVRFGGD